MAQPTPLTRDLASAVKGGLFATAFGAAGIAGFVHGSVVGGLLFGGLGVMFGWGAVQARRGTCPSCGARMKADSKAERCEKCDAFAFVERDRLVPVASDFVGSSPWLTMSTLQLRALPEWKWPWAERCAVCGRAATRKLPLQVKLLTGVMGPMRQVTTWNLGIPHCAEHQDGIGFSNAGAEPLLGFRSYAHYWDFLKANRRPGR